MKRLTETDARKRMRNGRTLMVTFQPDGSAFALDNGIGVSKRAAEKMTGQCELFAPCSQPGALVPNDDGLFPGITQTWRVA
jgi:hypothetical protein